MNHNQQYGAYLPGHPINQFCPTIHPGGHSYNIHNLNDGHQYSAQKVNFGSSFHFDFTEPGEYRLELTDLAAELSFDWPQHFSSPEPGYMNSSQQNKAQRARPKASCRYQQSKFTHVKPKTTNKNKRSVDLQTPAFAPPPVVPHIPQYCNGTETQQFNSNPQCPFPSSDCLTNRPPLQQLFPSPASSFPYSSDCSSLSNPSVSWLLQSNNAPSKSDQKNFSSFGIGMEPNFSYPSGPSDAAQKVVLWINNSPKPNEGQIPANIPQSHYGGAEPLNNPGQQSQHSPPNGNEHINGSNANYYGQYAM